jgi:hypothetical protein
LAVRGKTIASSRAPLEKDMRSYVGQLNLGHDLSPALTFALVIRQPQYRSYVLHGEGTLTAAAMQALRFS